MPAVITSSDSFERLPESFYEHDTARVARALLGHWLIRREESGFSGGMIVETEAYLAHDPACHAFCGRTARNAPMFGPPGRAYVYFIYGSHWCFNAVCGAEGVGEAVLVRAIEPLFGVGQMRSRRPGLNDRALTNGPGKLCAALGIGRAENGASLCAADSPVFLARNPRRTADVRRLGPVLTTARIGLTKAAEWPLRFVLGGSASI